MRPLGLICVNNYLKITPEALDSLQIFNYIIILDFELK